MPWLHGHDFLLEHSDLVLILLRDDHYYVRQHVAKYVQNLCSTGQAANPIISSRAEEMFVRWLNDTMQPKSVVETQIQFWIALLDRQLFDLTDPMTPDPTEMFNKNEANLFGEKFNTARMIYGVLKASLFASNGNKIALKYQHLEVAYAL